VHTPGVFVQRVVALTSEQVADKKIEKRTTRPRPEGSAPLVEEVAQQPSRDRGDG
jgi:3-oxoacid CoA-transferase subunit A